MAHRTTLVLLSLVAGLPYSMIKKDNSIGFKDPDTGQLIPFETLDFDALTPTKARSIMRQLANEGTLPASQPKHMHL